METVQDTREAHVCKLKEVLAHTYYDGFWLGFLCGVACTASLALGIRVGVKA